MDYLNTLNESGKNLLNQVLESGKYQATEKLILAIKSLQGRIMLINKEWKVETEIVAGKKGRIDLMISSKNNVIIIENKINNAIDQPNQLYRYWKNIIALPKKDQTGDIQRKGIIIYLTKSNKEPLFDSLCKPNNQTYIKKYFDLPDTMPLTVINLTYNSDIILLLIFFT